MGHSKKRQITWIYIGGVMERVSWLYRTWSILAELTRIFMLSLCVSLGHVDLVWSQLVGSATLMPFSPTQVFQQASPILLMYSHNNVQKQKGKENVQAHFQIPACIKWNVIPLFKASHMAKDGIILRAYYQR